MDWIEGELDGCEEQSALDVLADEEEEETDTGWARRLARARDLEPLAPAPRLALTPRPYQEDALAAWKASDGRRR